MAWVALHALPQGCCSKARGELVRSKAYGLTNATVDLQQVDVLPGQSRVVVRIDARRTAVDVALNERLEIDDARVVLLSTDRGWLERSRTLMLSEKRLRESTPRTRAPPDYAHAKLLGKPGGTR